MNPQGYIDNIVAASKEGRLLVLCGAGVSISTTNGDSRASWRGFIRYAIDWCRENGVNLVGESGLQRAAADLDSGDLLSAADKIHRGIKQANQWTSFIGSTFKDFKIANAELVAAIGALQAPIVTTNYDTLIETCLGLAAISWRSELFAKCLQDRAIGVGHIHGVWTEPDSIVFGNGSYGRLSAVETVSALKRAIGLRSVLLFVGVGEGIDDPNIGELISHLESFFPDSGLGHYQLISASDAPRFRTNGVVRPIVFGNDYGTELAPFIRSLAASCGLVDLSTQAASNPTPTDRNELLAAPLLGALGARSPTLGKIWPELLIDILVRPLRDLDPQPILLSRWAQIPNRPSRVAIIGVAGAGKSTALRRIALTDGAFASKYEFFAAQMLGGVKSLADSTSVAVVIDGIDEVGDSEVAHIVELLKSVPNRPLLISCRSEFFEREGPARPLLDSMNQVLAVQPLTDQAIDDFVDGYVKQTNLFPVKESIDSWRSNASFAELMRVPINLTLALFLASGHQVTDASEAPPATRFDLYDRFYRYWLNYEIGRAKLGPSSLEWIRASHIRLATKIYRQRQGDRVSVPALVNSSLNSKEEVSASFLITYEGSPRGVIRFRHDTYMEYILAANLIGQLRVQSSARPTLEIAFNDDVNAFVRDAFFSLSQLERERMLLRLTLVYEQSPNGREREHALYYIGRLGLAGCPEILVRAFREERDDLARRAAALGAILHGNTAIEMEFLRELEHSESFSELNMSVQLIYFGDASGNLHDYRGLGAVWSRTRAALFARLTAADERAVKLRWWDLQTLASLSRYHRASLTEQEQQSLKAVVDKHSGRAMDRDVGICRLAGQLLEPAAAG